MIKYVGVMENRLSSSIEPNTGKTILRNTTAPIILHKSGRIDEVYKITLF
jgi:hypothetical protein